MLTLTTIVIEIRFKWLCFVLWFSFCFVFGFLEGTSYTDLNRKQIVEGFCKKLRNIKSTMSKRVVDTSKQEQIRTLLEFLNTQYRLKKLHNSVRKVGKELPITLRKCVVGCKVAFGQNNLA